MKTSSLLALVMLTFIISVKTYSAPIVFADPNLKALLLSASSSNTVAVDATLNFVTIDLNADGEIDDTTEAPLIYRLNIVYSTVTNVSGIEYFINLIGLNCDHSPINSLSIGAFTQLENLRFAYTNISSFNCYGHPTIKTIVCYSSQLTSLNVANCPNLLTIDCSQNLLTAFDFTNDSLLTNVDCSYNNLNNLFIGGVPALTTFNAIHNNMSSFLTFSAPNITMLNLAYNNFTNITGVLSGVPNLIRLYIGNNNLSALDVSLLHHIDTAGCENNPNLVALNIKNGAVENTNFSGCPNLTLICIDDNQQATIDAAILANGYTNCHANPYCTMFPGGDFYTISGENKLDANFNGCDFGDNSMKNIKFQVFNGVTTNDFFTDQTGYYNYFVPAGNYTLTPIFENPGYFNYFSSSPSVSFPTDGSPFYKNYCFIPNGIHNDLEIVMVPVNNAEPGFVAHYKMIIKNNGTATLDPTVTLDFDALKLNYSIASPIAATVTSNQITWAFTGLLPFDSTTIDIAFQVHNPTGADPANIGNLLTFNATVSSLEVEETPVNNQFSLHQTVVGAFDPNDKTCLEGSNVGIEKIGEYVHYLIRFENTGTFNAHNVIVKDVIDTTKFEISTLIPSYGSHNFETKISNGNMVEFIFKDINLPFDDANNDGYIAFKIKTKSSLTVGDTFSNAANIYFDYNAPVLTNNFSTTIQTLSLNQNELKEKVLLYPNPIKDMVHFKTESNIIKVEILDVSGRILSSNAVNNNEMNLNKLSIGHYFLRIFTDAGTVVEQIIKE